jgi:hypothetical protein
VPAYDKYLEKKMRIRIFSMCMKKREFILLGRIKGAPPKRTVMLRTSEERGFQSKFISENMAI